MCWSSWPLTWQLAGVSCVQVWMLILRYFAGVMAWVSIITVNVALLGCTLYAYNMAGLLTQAGQWGATIAAQLPTGSDPTGVQGQPHVRLCRPWGWSSTHTNPARLLCLV